MIALGSLTTAGFVATLSGNSSPSVTVSLPKQMLWAWERPEELSYIDSKKVGIALFIRRYRLYGDDVLVVPRAQVLRMPQDARRIAVVRIEPSEKNKPTLSPKQRTQLLKELARLTKLAQIEGLQVDFDARITERQFYTLLMQELRKEVGPGYFLSMTALASWCLSDNWLKELPVNEVVPMLFDMGADSVSIKKRLSSNNSSPFSVAKEKLSFGFSTKEIDVINIFKKHQPQTLKDCQRVYIFSPKSWTRESYRGAISGVEL